MPDDYSDLGAVAIAPKEDYSDLGAIPAKSQTLSGPKTNIDEGFPVSGSLPEIRQSPPKGIVDKVISFFRDEDKHRARAGNIYALSEATGLPLSEINKNYEILKKSSEVTGINTEMDDKEYLQMLMLPGVVAGAIINPIGTAAGLIAYGVLDKAIPTEKLINKMKEEGISDDAIKVVEMADLVGKGMIVGGVFKKSGSIPETFLKQKITEYKLPETVTLNASQVRDIYQTGTLTTPEQKSLWAALELNSFDRRAALEHGININVPSEKTVRIVDNPLWAKVKNMFGMTEEPAIVQMSKAGETTKAPLGLLEGKISDGNITGTITNAPKEETKVDPVGKMISALKEAKDVRKKQETLYEEARSKKFAKLQSARSGAKGESGFYKELGALKGELPKVEFEAIRGKIGQQDIDALFQQIRTSPLIGEWEKINAMQGLSKMLGEEGGRVPTEGELSLLNEVFGKEFTEAVLEKRSMFQKIAEAGYQIANIPRSIMASFDLSAPLRQGIFFIGRQKQFGPAFKKMFQAFKSEEAYTSIQDSIITHPDYQLARDSRLSLTDLDAILGTREEHFMSSWAERIPVIGEGIKASGRAYIGFLNKLRFDVFTDLVNKADALGLEPRKNRDLLKGISDFINNATGRGTLPRGLQNSAVALNSIFFSPRLLFSRLNLLNPMFYVKQDPFVRKEALKSLFSFLGAGLTALTLAKMVGAEVGSDPRSSDFGKIRIKNTRFDLWGGFQPLVRVMGQLISGKYISSTTGKEMTLGEGYKPMTRADIVQRFLEGKLAPIPSFIVTLMKQQGPLGQELDVPKEIGKRFVPMILQDTYDLAKENPELVPASVLSIFGIGVQTYEDRQRKGF